MAKGEVRYKLTLDEKDFSRGVKQAEAEFKKFTDSVANGGGQVASVLGSMGGPAAAVAVGIGAASLAFGAFANSLKNGAAAAIEAGGHLSDLSAKTGIGVEALQRLQYAGSLVGVGLDQMTSAVTKMQKEMVTAPEKFKALGLSMQQLKSMQPDQQLAAVAKALSAMSDPAQRSAEAIALLGKSGAEMLPLLTSNLGAAMEKAQQLGLVMSGQTVAGLDATGDAVDTLSQVWDGLWKNMGAAIAANPAMADGINAIADALGSLSSDIQNVDPEVQKLVSAFLVKGADIGVGLVGAIDNAAHALLGLGAEAAKFEQAHPWIFRGAAALATMGMSGPLGNVLGAFDGASTAGGAGVRGSVKGTNNNADILAASAAKKKAAAEAAKQHAEALKQEEAAIRATMEALRAHNTELDKNLSAHESLLKALGPSAEDANFQMGQLAASMEAWGGASQLTDAQLTKLIDDMQKQAALGGDNAYGWDAYSAALEEARSRGLEAGMVIEETTQKVVKQGKSAEQAAQENQQFVASVRALADGFMSLGDAVGGAFGTILSLGGGAIGVFSNLADAALQAKSNTEKAAMAMQAAAGIINMGRNTRSGSQRAMNGAMSGAAAGAAFGPMGAAIGAVAGGLLGLFSGPKWGGAAKAGARVFGGAVSDELAKAIYETSKKLGVSTGQAALLHITDAMKEQGKSAGSYSPQILQLMDGIAKGAIPAAEGIKELGEAFQQVADEAMKASAIGSKALADILQKARATGGGVYTAEMKAFSAEQLSKAAAGVAGMTSGIGVTSQEGANAQAQIFSATFWGLFREKGFAAIQEMQPAFQALMDKLTAGGFNAPALLGPISQLFAEMTPEVQGVLDGITGLQQAFEGLSAAGYMTQESFSAFGQTAVDAFNQATAAGLDQNAALAAIAPMLADIQKAHQQYGLEIDDSTQALLDQAAAAGIAFPVDPIIQMTQAINDLIAAIREANNLPPINPVAGGGGGGGGSYSGGSASGGPAGPPERNAGGGFIPYKPGGEVIRVSGSRMSGSGEHIVPDSMVGSFVRQHKGGGGDVHTWNIIQQPGEDSEALANRIVAKMRSGGTLRRELRSTGRA